ncbi:Arf-GAP with SH3 domain, ANK repeat and PH domain-containing protein [Schistosoma japonicum]|uniref:Arf-GAP with SH3 domain, ANK repeat and PH domain-containing protein n=1 Tax=Schistosoma japonicum TaxID=6182 RepID=A0A4Z2D0E3_SCHJA|nr:Arf-GAP with SH3 domain, ANK repeat and PH domain-containing protein [Schistosoma japonicum]
MTKHLMQNLNSIVVFPMETFMQGDIKSDIKKPFEKALKDYEYKYDKLRKEKLQMMKETGCYAPEAFTEGMTKDLEKERRKLQLETCEYLIKVNELKAKRSADLLQHLIDFFYVQTHYLRECLGVMDHFGKSMGDLASRVNGLHKINDAQKRRLVDTREEVRGVLDKECDSVRRKSRLFGQSVQTGVTYAAQPTQVNKAFGTKKSGFLLKKSDGKVKRVWQRRRVRIADGELWLYHADETKPPVRLTLLTCQVKLPTESVDNDSILNHGTTGGGNGGVSQHSTSEGKLYFDLVSNSRTYNFQAEDEQEYEEWISVLNNAMQEEFNRAMNGESYQTPSYDLSETFNLSSNRGNSNNNCSNSNRDSLTTGIDLVYATLTCQGNNPIHNNSKHMKSDSFGDSLPGSENDLLDSSGSQISRSRESHLDSADAISTDGINTTEFKGRPSKSIIQSSLRFYAPGNEICADCGRPDPEWVSVNLGILICLECCGAHRELGVHHSRTQSLLMDDLSTNQLLLPRFIGNQLFNSVYESSLPADSKPNASDPVSDSDGMAQRRAFIKSKYVDRRFITKTTSDQLVLASNSSDYDANGNKFLSDDISSVSNTSASRDPVSERFLRRDLLRAVKTGNLSLLIQVYAERLDLMTPFQPEDDDSFPLLAGTTALHVAVETTNKFFFKSKSHTSHRNEHPHHTTESFLNLCGGEATWDYSIDNHELEKPPHCNLPLVEFIIQNSPSGSLKRANELGDTALHHAARYGCVDALKLIIQAGGVPTSILQLTNHNGQTALDIVETMLTDENSAELMDAYQNCQRILKLADILATSISSANNRLLTDSVCALFPSNIDGSADRLSIYRTNLIESLDQLNSVNWCHLDLSSSSASIVTTTSPLYILRNGKSHYLCNKRVAIATTSTPSASTATIANTSEAFNSKLGAFSLSHGVKNVNQISTLNSCESYRQPKTRTTGKQITFDANPVTTCNNVPAFNKPVRSFSHHSPSNQYGSILATLPRKKGPAPRPPSGDGQMNDTFDSGIPTSSDFLTTFNRLNISRISSSSIDHDKPLPNDHIDIILDVLEEKPSNLTTALTTSSSTTTSSNSTISTGTTSSSSTMTSSTKNPINSCFSATTSTLTTSSINASPPIPPKPNYISNTMYSTLPSRSSHSNANNTHLVFSNLPVLCDSSHVESTVNSSDHLVDSLSKHMDDKFSNSLRSISSRSNNSSCISSSSISWAKTSESKLADLPLASKFLNKTNNLPTINCKIGDLFEALYDCEAENPDELTFVRGEIIQLVDRPDDDWWEGFIHSNPSRRGMFPVTYVKHILNS